MPDPVDLTRAELFSTLATDAVRYTTSGMRSLGIVPPPSQSALHRWRLSGVRGCKPDTFMRGGRRYVTPTAMHEFFAAVTAAAEQPGPSVHSPQQRSSSRVDKATAELAEEGID